MPELTARRDSTTLPLIRNQATMSSTRLSSLRSRARPAAGAKRTSVAIVDPNGEANLWRYDACLANSLEGEPLECVLISSRHFDSGTLGRVPLYRFYNYKRFHNGLLRGISYGLGTFRTYWFLVSRKIQVVHFQWFKLPTLDWMVIRCLRLLSPNCRIAHTAHNLLPHDSGRRYFSRYRRIYRAVDAIIVHADASKHELVAKFRIPKEKIHVIPHGLLYSSPTSTPSETWIRSSIADEAPRIVSILGLIHRYKGHDRAIKAWKASTISRNPKWLLLIAGKGEPRYIRELLEECQNCPTIRIIDRFLDDSEFDAFARKSSLSLFPYRNISQSGALLTNLALGKPFVVSNIGGLADPLKIADVGWCLDDSLFTEQLAALLNLLSADQASLDEKTRNHEAWGRIHRHYSWRTIGAQTGAVYRSLASRVNQTRSTTLNEPAPEFSPS